MMYNINDTILYGSHGVCTVTEITQKIFKGKPIEYYVLKPVYNDKSTLYVPIENKNLTEKMHKVLSAAEISRIMQSMPYEDSGWIENENERKEKYKEILTAGDRMALVKIIKALYLHKQEQKSKGKKLHISDEHFLRDAEKILYDEFALVLKINPDQVLPLILEQIQIEEKSNQE